jgi:hypothetical protein
MKQLMIAAAILVPSVANATGVYITKCEYQGQSYPLTVNEDKEILEWLGKKYHVTVANNDDCAKYCWLAKGHGTSFQISTATQGAADFTFNGSDVSCQTEEGRRKEALRDREAEMESKDPNDRTKIYLASQDMFLRTEPNPNSDSVLGPPPYDYIPKNTRISVHINRCEIYHADTRDSQWCKADYSDYSGWVNTRYLIN